MVLVNKNSCQHEQDFHLAMLNWVRAFDVSESAEVLVDPKFCPSFAWLSPGPDLSNTYSMRSPSASSWNADETSKVPPKYNGMWKQNLSGL